MGRSAINRDSLSCWINYARREDNRADHRVAVGAMSNQTSKKKEVDRFGWFSDGMREGYDEGWVRSRDYDALAARVAELEAKCPCCKTAQDVIDLIADHDRLRAALEQCNEHRDDPHKIIGIVDAALAGMPPYNFKRAADETSALPDPPNTLDSHVAFFREVMALHDRVGSHGGAALSPERARGLLGEIDQLEAALAAWRKGHTEYRIACVEGRSTLHE